MTALFAHTRISPEVREHRYFQRLTDAVSEASTLTNDVVSLKKELRRDERDNLVLIKVIQGSSPPEALKETVKIVWDQTLEAIRHAELLQSSFLHDKSLNQYLNHAWTWMNANATAPAFMRRYEYVGVKSLFLCDYFRVNHRENNKNRTFLMNHAFRHID
jgi:hypothetical protein